MAPIDIDTLRTRIRAMDFEPGTPEQIVQLRDDFLNVRANLAIEDMAFSPEDEAMFQMMIDEGAPAATIATVVRDLFRPKADQIAA